MDSPESERPETVQKKIREALGVRLFKPAPKDFDPIKASARELLVYGYPARPDARLNPKLHEHWNQMMSRPVSIVEPQFAVMKDKGHEALRFGPPGPPRLPGGTRWAGFAKFAAKDDKVTWVTGQWTVPRVIAPTKNLEYACANWVGIDHAFGDPNGILSQYILQAGTTQRTRHYYFPNPFYPYHPIDYTEYDSWAWFQWFPAKPFEITSLLVLPGDTVSCVICVNTSTEALIYLRNVTTGVMVSWTQTAPTGDDKVQFQVLGHSAEWILEAPTHEHEDVYLPPFGDVYFDYCVAGTKNGALLDAGTGTPLELLAATGLPPLATAKAETDRLIKIIDP